MAWVQVCAPGAVIHKQDDFYSQLDVGAILYTSAPPWPEALSQLAIEDIYQANPQEPLSGSAAAARAMLDLYTERQPATDRVSSAIRDDSTRIGVLICQCGGEISEVVDTQVIRDSVAALPDVVHVQVMPFSCTQEAAQAIGDMVNSHELTKVLLAGCSCCSIDQVCSACTYQRVRCKDNLGLYTQIDNLNQFEFVNIREQCAWVHRDDPDAAMAKAQKLVTAAVARARTKSYQQVKTPPVQRSTLIIGSEAAAKSCGMNLSDQDIAVLHIEDIPDQLKRAGGQYVVTRGDAVWGASALVLAPRNIEEARRLLVASDQNGYRPQIHTSWDASNPRRSGIVYCDPDLDPELTGTAAAAQVAAWLGVIESRKTHPGAIVDSTRCRVCGTCVQICEFAAPEIAGDGSLRSAWIDPAVCTCCGTCAAHCPSGAITAGYPSEAELEATLEIVLG
jgi:formate hydrogenlyase subunit 6/NADH:ubiquinone oxidoreductase subunit I